ncbi:MAG: putative transposase, partial [Candidatus Azotimanducaceae bacterium]
MSGMRPLVLLFIHLLVLVARSLKSGGVKSVIAENLLLKQQLIVLGRPRNKAPNLQTSDRFVLGG